MWTVGALPSGPVTLTDSSVDGAADDEHPTSAAATASGARSAAVRRRMDVLCVEIAVWPAYRPGCAGRPYAPAGAGSGGTGSPPELARGGSGRSGTRSRGSLDRHIRPAAIAFRIQAMTSSSISSSVEVAVKPRIWRALAVSGIRHCTSPGYGSSRTNPGAACGPLLFCQISVPDSVTH